MPRCSAISRRSPRREILLPSSRQGIFQEKDIPRSDRIRAHVLRYDHTESIIDHGHLVIVDSRRATYLGANMLRDGVQRLTCRRCGTLLLSSAASLCVIADARAADLPVKAKAVEYMRVCSLYGTGFWYIPGTDSWMQVSDYLRVDTTFDAAGSHGQPAWNGGSGEHDRYFDQLRLSLSPAVAHLHAGQHPVQHLGTANSAVVGAAPSLLAA